MIDVLFGQPKSGKVRLQLLGKTDTGIRLYQKLLILILSPASQLYREQQGTNLVSYLGHINALGDSALTALGTEACNKAKGLLDPQDSSLVQSVQAEARNSVLYITMKLIDGTSYTGALDI